MAERRIRRSVMIHGLLSMVVLAAAAPAAAQPMQYEVLHAFDRPPVRAPYGGLLRASDGAFYGPMSRGGDSGLGAIIRYEPRASREKAMTIAHAFSGPDGGLPFASLIEGPGGVLYGTTYIGGAHNRGTIYRYDLASRALTTLHSFDLVPAFPYGGLLLASDGMLYGAAGSGGPPGAFFRFDLSTSTLNVIHAYSGQAPDGGWPAAAPVQAADGRIYGTNGALGGGVIYRYDPATGSYATVRAFVPATGTHPHAPLVRATDGRLYGTTSSNGTHGMGVLFRFDPATSAYTVLHHFGPASGATPYAPVHQGPDGALYGTTDAGGLHGRGTLYRYDLVTASLTVLEHFDGVHGASPRGAVIDAGDGTLLGTAFLGGVGLGTIYRYHPAAGVSTLHRFTGRGGSNPYAGLVEGGDGALYGTTADGGPSGEGTVFRYHPATGVATLHAFGGITGSGPVAGLVRGADDRLYGTTRGAAPGAGTLYRYDPAAGAVEALHTFTMSWFGPDAALLQGSDGALYGAAADTGGPQSPGTIFRFDPATATLTHIHSFPIGGSEASSTLIEGSDGALYGTTTTTGGGGSLFRFDPATASYSTLHGSLDSARAAVLQGADGSFYGTTARGGAFDAGTVFGYAPSTAAYRIVYSFFPFTGSTPIASLVQRADGALLGTTQRGGANDEGTIFRVDTAGNHVVLHSFTRASGARPAAALYQGADGALYGTTVEGGPYGGGVLFRLSGATADDPARRPTSR